ncbi:MAG: AbrB/MazE/SpoVT family DNA-binding domain-containing protein [Lachnospiraceae bacterium]|nr:AbrB/MazE/SpoVT family DNA-binding domain-containing protein [Lachnospiraceae bacterium]
MDVAIRAWGNSQGIRIPKEILDTMQLKVSDTLSIEVEKDTIILRKQFKHKTFEERLAAYAGRISTCDFDWGEPEGREML